MSIQSISCLTKSKPRADRIVDQLRASGFAPEEISVLIPEEPPAPASGAPPTDRKADPERQVQACEGKPILISVHLDGGNGMGRAEEIFVRARSEAILL